MTGLRDASCSLRNRNQFVTFWQAARKWLLDQHIGARFHELSRNREVLAGGDGNRSSIDLS
jgi:hypothetical protein